MLDTQQTGFSHNLSDCLEKIHQAILKNRAQRYARPDNPDKLSPGELTHLAHYTTADGLCGIVMNGNLRATAAYYLNDSSEIDYGCALLTAILKESATNAKENDTRKVILEQTERAFEASGLMASIVPRTYVACFCENENLLSQWRAYGQSGGYSIGFRRQALETGLAVEEDSYHVGLRRVIYDEGLQTSGLRDVLSDFLSALERPSIRESAEKLDAQEKKVFFISFNMFLQTAALTEIVRFKHPAFKDEKEWRLVVRPTSSFLNQAEISQLKFRPSRGMVVPYLELKPKVNGTPLPIDYVRYGPTLDKKRAEKSLDLLFKQKGYVNVKFHGSDIPVIL